MNFTVGALAATGRFARRLIGRRFVAHALLAIMVAVPLAGLAVVLIQQNSTLSHPQSYLATRLGPEATARIDYRRAVPIVQDLSGRDTRRVVTGVMADDDNPRSLDEFEAQLSAAIGTGTLVASTEVRVSLRSNDRATDPLILQATEAGQDLVPLAVDGTWPSGRYDIALSQEVAQRLGVRAGDDVAVADQGAGITMRVTGTFASNDDVAALAAFPPSEEVSPDFSTAPLSFSWYVSGGDPVEWNQVQSVNDLGASVTSRAVVTEQSEANPGITGGSAALIDLALMAAAGVLVVLISVPAFLINAGRSRRELALFVASGATRTQVTFVQLWIGMAVGAAGAVAGLALGILVSLLMFRLGALPGAVRLNFPPSLVGLLALGVLASVVGALLSSWGVARVQVTSAIADRSPGSGMPRVRVTRFACGAFGLGVAVVGVLVHNNLVVGAGVLIAAIGLILATGTLMNLVARNSSQLVLPVRMALRDAARHPRRTTPALVVIVVLCTVVVGSLSYVESANDSARRTYHPTISSGTLEVRFSPLASGNEAVTSARIPGLVSRLTDMLNATSATTIDALIPDEDAWSAGDPSILVSSGSTSTMLAFDSLQINDGSAADSLGFTDATQAADGLREGKVLVSSGTWIRDDGTILITVSGKEAVSWPAIVVPSPADTWYFAAPPSLAQRLGLTVQPARVLLAPSPGTQFSVEQEDSVRALSVSALAPNATATVRTERGYVPDVSTQAAQSLALGAAVLAGLLALAVTVLTVRDQKAELRIFGAVGATPRTLGAMAAIQSATLASFGTVLGAVTGGLLSGLVILGFARSDPSWGFSAPWLQILTVIVVAVALSAVVSGTTAWRAARRPIKVLFDGE